MALLVIKEVLLVPDSVVDLGHQHDQQNDHEETVDHVPVDSFLKISNLVLVLTLVHDLFGVGAGVDDDCNDFLGVLEHGSTGNEVFECKVLGRFRTSFDATTELVNVHLWLNVFK